MALYRHSADNVSLLAPDPEGKVSQQFRDAAEVTQALWAIL